MILRQFLHTDPVAASYLLGSGKSGGAVVDPECDFAVYLEAAEAIGTRILYVIDTHLRADHLSVGREVAKAAGALHADAAATYAFKGVQDGDELKLGNVAIRCMHMPGHTLEPISLVVTDRTRSEDTLFILTGHTLMVGYAFRVEDEAAFVQTMVADIPPPPPCAAQTRAVNAGQSVAAQ